MKSVCAIALPLRKDNENMNMCCLMRKLSGIAVSGGAGIGGHGDDGHSSLEDRMVIFGSGGAVRGKSSLIHSDLQNALHI